MNILTLLLKSSRSLVTTALILGILSGGSSAALIALISYALDQPDPGPWLMTGFSGLSALTLAANMGSRLVLIRLAQGSIFQLQLHLSRQILKSDLCLLETLGSGRLLANLTEDIQTISNAAIVLPIVSINIAVVIGCGLYIIWLSGTIFLFVLLLAIAAIWSCLSLLKQARRFLALARDDQDQLFNHFRGITEGIKDLKLNYWRQEAFLGEDLQSIALEYKRHSSSGLFLISVTETWGRLVFLIAVGSVLFFLPGSWQLPPERLASYVLTFTFLLAPLESIVGKLPFITRANIALKKIETLGSLLSAQSENYPPPTPAQSSWHTLELKEVTHTYYTEQAEGSFTLGPIDLVLHPGEIIFIVGGNGSGKSTLAKLLTGLYTPQSGSILLGGTAINEHNREWYRQHFSAIFADYFLFERLMGLNSYDLDQQARQYLEKLQLERKVTIQNGHLSTINLSQGQRKRLALLTACLENRPIYLFDEWAADQDPSFKKVFYTQFLSDLREQGKAVIVISHDDRYFNQADRLVKLESGQVIPYTDAPVI